MGVPLFDSNKDTTVWFVSYTVTDYSRVLVTEERLWLVCPTRVGEKLVH